MAEEIKMHKKRESKNSEWMKFLTDNFFGMLKLFVEGTFSSAEQVARAFVGKLVSRAFLIFLVFLGTALLFIGVAKVLSATYRLPGAGEALVGMAVLLVSLAAYAFLRDKR